MFFVQINIENFKKEPEKFKRFAIFTSLYYVEHWFSAPLAREAPFIDLAFYQDMLEYQHFDKTVPNAVLENLRRHTWFMNMEYAPLSLFSSEVDDK